MRGGEGMGGPHGTVHVRGGEGMGRPHYVHVRVRGQEDHSTCEEWGGDGRTTVHVKGGEGMGGVTSTVHACTPSLASPVSCMQVLPNAPHNKAETALTGIKYGHCWHTVMKGGAKFPGERCKGYIRADVTSFTVLYRQCIM